MSVICPKCNNENIIVYRDNIKQEMSLCICNNKSCGNTSTLKEFLIETN